MEARSGSSVLMRVRGLSKEYLHRRWLSRKRAGVRALEGVDLEIRAGSTLALVGESGSGKSTLGTCLACLERPDSGQIWFEGRDLLTLPPGELFPLRRQIQMVFQDSANALNPRLSAAELIAEPLLIQREGTAGERRRRALEWMEEVGLSRKWSERRPMELSGGQRQRIAIARALSLCPKLLILDESLTGLDLSVQAQVVNLLLDLQQLHSLTYLFISHDLGLLGHVADEIAVLHRGRLVERGTATEIFTSARHPQTRALLASIPYLRLPA